MELVVDASVFVKLLIEEPGSDRAEELVAQADRLFAPDLLIIETANTLWKKVRRQGLPQDGALDSLEEAQRFDVELVSSADLLVEALAIACELPHPLYDCLYLLLALRGGRALATADARMREAAEGLGVRVEWVGS
jgi:predicted nucleic acid-binding protein